MDVKRITVEEATAAYETTGIRPVVQVYFSSDYFGPNDHCGCPAFAVAVARSGQSLAELRAAGGFNSAELVEATFDESYLQGFTAAVDGRSNFNRFAPEPEVYDQGREDGLAVRAALWPEPANA